MPSLQPPMHKRPVLSQSNLAVSKKPNVIKSNQIRKYNCVAG